MIINYNIIIIINLRLIFLLILLICLINTDVTHRHVTQQWTFNQHHRQLRYVRNKVLLQNFSFNKFHMNVLLQTTTLALLRHFDAFVMPKHPGALILPQECHGILMPVKCRKNANDIIPWMLSKMFLITSKYSYITKRVVIVHSFFIFCESHIWCHQNARCHKKA